MSKINEHTGDRLINNKGDQEKYRDNWDRIFGKKNTERVTYLDDNEFEEFLNMVDNPPEPSEKLKEAARKLNSKNLGEDGSRWEGGRVKDTESFIRKANWKLG